MKAIMSWSTGKDSAMALHRVLEEGALEVRALLTTVGTEFDRVSMHGVRRELAERQARALGLELMAVEVPPDCTMESYDLKMRSALENALADGITTVVFGDLFLEDVRAYREQRLAEAGIEAVFPLWGEDTAVLAGEMVDAGIKAVVTCVDTEQLDGSFVGRQYNREFLQSLPTGVDPCGENGEFHTFCWSSPDFQEPVAFARGETVVREQRFRFFDVVAGF